MGGVLVLCRYGNCPWLLDLIVSPSIMAMIPLQNKDVSLPFQFLRALLILPSIRLLPDFSHYLASVGRIQQIQHVLEQIRSGSSVDTAKDILRILRNDRKYQTQISYQGCQNAAWPRCAREDTYRMPPIGLFAVTLSSRQPCTEQTTTQPKSITSLTHAALTIALPLQPLLHHRVGGLPSPSLFVPIETWKCARRSKALASRIGLPVLGGRFWLIRLNLVLLQRRKAFFFAWLNMLYLEMMYCIAYSGLSLV